MLYCKLYYINLKKNSAQKNNFSFLNKKKTKSLEGLHCGTKKVF